MILRVVLLLTLAILGPAGSALATVLTTPRLPKAAGDDLQCNLVNAGTRPLEVTFVIMNSNGTLTGGSTVTVAPNASFQYSTVIASSAYCQFTFSGSKSKVRANACVSVGGRCIATADAR